MPHDDKPIDVEFVGEAGPAAVKCRCPACPTMLDPAARYCDHCRTVCIALLKRSHAMKPVVAQASGDARAIVDGVKSAARVANGIADIAAVFTGKSPRRRLR